MNIVVLLKKINNKGTKIWETCKTSVVKLVYGWFELEVL